jgi:hypothetical protein
VDVKKERHMKTRSGFVSNSSSSSFIICGSSGVRVKIPDYLINDGVLTLNEGIGETEFGWGPDAYYPIDHRLSLCVVALQYINDRSYYADMLSGVIKLEDPRITEVVIPSEDYGYIDHQSIPELTSMYDNVEKLRDFLFDASSYIRTDNDNH